MNVRQNAINKGSSEIDFTKGAAEETAIMAIMNKNGTLLVCCSRLCIGLMIF
jgi:hypothetical protein